MFFELFILLVGLGVIIKGGDLFVSASIRIAQFLRLPRVVTGSTLVSLATTSPELVVSITAGVKGESGIALGNAVGSAVCNIGLVLATTAKQFTVRPSEFASSFDSDASLRCGPVRDHARSSAVADGGSHPSSGWGRVLCL